MNNLQNTNVLVTGGLGFVGSNVVASLVKDHSANVTVLDDLFTGQPENLHPYTSSVRLVHGTVGDAQLVQSLVYEADFVLHLAARNIIASTADPQSDLETNIRGTLNILLAARASKRLVSLVYASTASVYGNPRYLPINEDDHVNLLSPYAASKFAGESYCRVFYELHGLPSVVVRYSNVFGPRQSPSNPYSGVVSKFIHRALRDQPLPIHGDGEQTRDYTYVDDAVEATLAAAQSPRAVGRVYNIATGRETSVNQLATAIWSLARSSPPKLEHIQRRDIDNVRRRVLNIEAIRHDLNWIPSHTLESGLGKAIDWLKTNE